MYSVETFSLSKDFGGIKAVRELELKIEEGELFSLLGPNGAGKTTTINMLSCLIKPTSGTARVMGYDIISEPHKVREVIGVSPQETILSEKLNAWENIYLFGRAYGISGSEIKRRGLELLERLGLKERAKDMVKKYSGGMKRRLSIILSLIHEPSVLFLDEPTLGFDPQARRAIWEYIEEMKGRRTILLTTHYMEEAERLSDRVGIMDEGRVIALGTPSELKRIYGGEGVLRISVRGEGDMGEIRKRWRVEEGDGEIRVMGGDFKEVLEALWLCGFEVISCIKEEPTLEDIFIKLTGKRIRE